MFVIFFAVPGLTVACGIWFPDEGLNLGPLHWEWRLFSHWTTRQVPPHCFLFAADCMTFHCMEGGDYCSLHNWPPLVNLNGYLFCVVLFLPLSYLLAGFRHFRDFSSVQSLSRVQLFATPWTEAHQAFLSITNSWSLLKLMSIESVMPSNHLIVVPFSSCLQSLSQHQALFQRVNSSHQVAKVLEFQLQFFQ